VSETVQLVLAAVLSIAVIVGLIVSLKVHPSGSPWARTSRPGR